MQLAYDLDSDSFYLDNMYEEYIKGASTEDIENRFDNVSEVVYAYDYAKIKDVSFVNATGTAVGDEFSDDLSFGSVKEYEINEDGVGSISFNSFMSLATGTCYGDWNDEITNTEIAQYLTIKKYPKRRELNVSDYGVRIGFLSTRARPLDIYYPSVAPPDVANTAPWELPLTPPYNNRLASPRYYPLSSESAAFPKFSDTITESGSTYSMGFAVKDSNGNILPSPADTTTVYDAFHKDYISVLYGNPRVSASFVLTLEELKDINGRNKYDYGDGDCLVLGMSGFDLAQEETKGKGDIVLL